MLIRKGLIRKRHIKTVSVKVKSPHWAHPKVICPNCGETKSTFDYIREGVINKGVHNGL